MMRRFARFLAPPVLATLLAVGATLPAHAAPTSTLEGLDVSHWQGVIDWKQVAGAGYDFAFAKATDGRTFKDPGFTYNREAAQFRGLAFGAYHFARPDKGPNDPAMEVNQFLNVADPQSGELIPVLDLEDSGGLTTDELIAWTWGFLIEFESRTGLKPMIYTGNYFWMTFMRNTQEFAQAGYDLLWLAHWGVPKPHVPANNWGGHGAKFWQYTSCGNVPGIGGCVDLDHYLGQSLDDVLVP